MQFARNHWKLNCARKVQIRYEIKFINYDAIIFNTSFKIKINKLYIKKFIRVKMEINHQIKNNYHSIHLLKLIESLKIQIIKLNYVNVD